jgi:hypothetical protein
MDFVEKKHNEAMKLIHEAQALMKQLSAISQDWTAAIIMDNEFESLKETCTDYSRCHFEIGMPERCKNSNKRRQPQ